ncbi:NAD(P)-binding protein [Gyrodon lividus]|nr:NAD(P)-binding protein [Gyrodon lividus]
MANRLAQVSGHISNTYGRGLLAGEVAIITGAGQGIGRSAALLFAKEGAKVVVSDIDAKKAAAVADEIKAAGGEAISVAGDVGADDFPKIIVDATAKAFGQINHIVNNAGFTYDKMLHTMPDDVYDVIMKIHVRAPFRLVRAAAPYFRVKSETPANRSIINVSSTSGLHGNVGQANYAAAKAAVVGLTKTVAKEWGPFGVRANTVAYGLVHTRLTAAKEDGATIEVDGKKVALGIPASQARVAESVSTSVDIPLRRGASADEAAAAMLFLASPLASYVSGHTLEVTGGRGI